MFGDFSIPGLPFHRGNRVWLTGLRPGNPLNNIGGILGSYDPDTKTWEFITRVVTYNHVKANNIVHAARSPDHQNKTPLVAGDQVEIHTLQGKKELNHTMGVLVQYYPDKERWQVQHIDKNDYLLKAFNLRRIIHSDGTPDWHHM